MEAAEIFKCFSDSNRLKIFNLLLHKSPLCVCEIEAVLSLTQSNVSRHLEKFRVAGIVDKHKKLQWSLYSINSDFEKKSHGLIAYLKEQMKNDKQFDESIEKLKQIDKKVLC